MSRMRAPVVTEVRAPARGARSRELPPPAPLPDRPSRIRLLLRRQRRMLRPALAIVGFGGIGLLFLGLVYALGHGGTFQTQFGAASARLGLRIRSVLVEGRQKTPEPALRAALGVGPGDPILDLSLPRARARVEAIQWVKSATIERLLPDTIVVQLTERRPFAVWQHDGRFVLIDRDGNTVTDSDVATFASQVPLVVGPGAPQAAAELIDVLSTQPALMAKMAAAVRVGERRWNLRMTTGVDVLLPEIGAPQALARLLELQSSHALLDRSLQSIDLRLPDRLVLRPSGEKSADPAMPFRKPT